MIQWMNGSDTIITLQVSMRLPKCGVFKTCFCADLTYSCPRLLIDLQITLHAPTHVNDDAKYQGLEKFGCGVVGWKLAQHRVSVIVESNNLCLLARSYLQRATELIPFCLHSSWCISAQPHNPPPPPCYLLILQRFELWWFWPCLVIPIKKGNKRFSPQIIPSRILYQMVYASQWNMTVQTVRLNFCFLSPFSTNLGRDVLSRTAIDILLFWHFLFHQELTLLNQLSIWWLVVVPSLTSQRLCMNHICMLYFNLVGLIQLFGGFAMSKNSPKCLHHIIIQSKYLQPQNMKSDLRTKRLCQCCNVVMICW